MKSRVSLRTSAGNGSSIWSCPPPCPRSRQAYGSRSPKAWLALVVIELVASSEGLGYLIVYGRQLFQLDLVMASVVEVCFIGYAMNRSLDALEARLRRGQPSAFHE